MTLPPQSILDLPDGARFVDYGAGGRMVLFIGRQNLSLSHSVRADFASLFQENGLRFVAFEPPYEAACRRDDPQDRLSRWPAPLRRVLRGLLFLRRLRTWKYLRPAQRREAASVQHWSASLLAAVRALPAPPAVLTGFSHGARVASLIADQLGVAGVVCFGYPFRNPDEPEDPARTAHLARLRTPCLIIQGSHDEYGGRDVRDRYPLSPAIAVEFVATNHGFLLSGTQWQAISGRLRQFCGVVLPAGPVAATQVTVGVPQGMRYRNKGEG